MRLFWYGHAAFLVETQGLRLILDPYKAPDAGSLAPIDEPADIVAVSHDNERYHSHLGQIVPPFEVVRGLDVPSEGLEVRGLRFLAVPVFESPDRKPEERVTMLHLQAEGLRLAFLGDLGHPLTPEELDPVRGAEIALVPAGGPPTIDFPHIPPLLKAIGPRLVIPMHYKIPGINLPILPVERFLEAMAGWRIERPGGSELVVDRDAVLAGSPRIVVLEPGR